MRHVGIVIDDNAYDKNDLNQVFDAGFSEIKQKYIDVLLGSKEDQEFWDKQPDVLTYQTYRFYKS